MATFSGFSHENSMVIFHSNGTVYQRVHSKSFKAFLDDFDFKLYYNTIVICFSSFEVLKTGGTWAHLGAAGCQWDTWDAQQQLTGMGTIGVQQQLPLCLHSSHSKIKQLDDRILRCHAMASLAKNIATRKPSKNSVVVCSTKHALGEPWWIFRGLKCMTIKKSAVLKKH